MDQADLIAKLTDLSAEFGLKAVAAILILVVGWWLAKLISRGAARAMDRSSLDPTLVHFLRGAIYYLLLAIVAVIALTTVGIQTASFVALLGAAGLAVGLALEGSLGNFAAGVLIMLFRPFKIGDYVEAADREGRVERIHIFNTTLVTYDNETVIIPNSDVTGGTVINYSERGHVRVEVPLLVGHDADFKRVKSLLMLAAAEAPRVINEPPAEVQITEFTEHAIKLQVEVTVDPKDREDVLFEVSDLVKARFDEAGISTPRQRLDLRLPKAETRLDRTV